MKILSITARNYRIHRDTTVDFDSARNLIGGANETGKSTLAEAMHRALFFRHRSGGEPQRAMRSSTHNGHPEVQLVFETGGHTWTLAKRFSGASGTARLSSDAGESHQGDAAEERLAQLVGNPEGAGTSIKQLTSQWAHLWVWQGCSGDNATIHTAGRKDELVRRLQEQGLAAVMQSEADEQVRESVRKTHDDIFTKTGAVKAGSKLDASSKALIEAEESLARTQDQKQRLEAAIADQEAATRIAAEAAAALPGLREQLASADASLAKVNDLQARLEMEAIQHQNAKDAREQLAKDDRQIRKLREQAATARKSLLPAEAKLSILSDREQATRETAAAADTACRSIADTVRNARQHHDLAAACVSQFEKSATCETLNAKCREVATIEKPLAGDRRELSKLPAISPARLESLRKLDSRHRLAEGALQAIAAGIELIGSDQPVLLDGKDLPKGEPRIITGAAELSLGTGTRLRINPGGGTSLEDSRKNFEKTRDKLARAFEELTVRDLDEAAAIVAKRQAIEQRISKTEAQLQAHAARELPEMLAEANTAHAAAAADVERRLAALGKPLSDPLPETLETARKWQGETSKAFEKADRQDSTLRKEAEAARKHHQQANTARQTQNESLESARQKLQNLEISATVLEENHGDAAARKLALDQAASAEAATATTLDATRKTLTELNPQALTSNRARVSRSITQQAENQNNAETRIAVARSTLALDGSTDPDAELLQARARLATAQNEHAREDRRAKAIALLHRLFTESQTAIGESVTQPIAERVAGYLECLFGRGVEVRVDLTNAGKPTLQLTRPGTPAFSFDSLSGGAREQVAAAVRLATAEILAASHDGCLPLVFDDAFAYADPERVQSLQRMLDLAATRGLQVIVLTCTPSDYIGLGAKEIRL